MLSDKKPELEKNINTILYNALYKAYMSTFESNSDSDPKIANRVKQEIDDAAKKFSKVAADEAAPELAGAIYNFVKSIGIMATPKALTSPVGPCAGVITMNEFKIY